jgi:hypothetical protein
MAYVNNETKAVIQAALKPVFKKYGIKATVARNPYQSTLIVNVAAGGIDFGTNDKSVNVYWINEHHTGAAKDFLNEVLSTIKSAGEWYDRSDAMTDYFDTAFYIDINIGRWNKPYQYNAVA